MANVESQSTPTSGSPRDADVVDISLCIYGAELDPKEITRVMGAEPTHAHRQDEARNPRYQPFATGAWIRTLSVRPPASVDAGVLDLLAQLSPDAGAWQSLAQRCQIRIALSAHVTDRVSIVLSPETIRLLDTIGAELDIGVFAYGDDA